MSRFSNLKSTDNKLIYRFDAQLFFANCEFFKNTIIKDIKRAGNVDEVIIEAAGIHHIDSSSVHMLKDLHDDLISLGITLKFSEVKGPLRDIFHRNGLFKKIKEENFFLTTEHAISNDAEVHRDYTLQVSS